MDVGTFLVSIEGLSVLYITVYHALDGFTRFSLVIFQFNVVLGLRTFLCLPEGEINETPGDHRGSRSLKRSMSKEKLMFAL